MHVEYHAGYGQADDGGVDQVDGVHHYSQHSILAAVLGQHGGSPHSEEILEGEEDEDGQVEPEQYDIAGGTSFVCKQKG